MCLIKDKLNELKWNSFLKEKNVDFHVKEIDRKIFKEEIFHNLLSVEWAFTNQQWLKKYLFLLLYTI